MQRVKVPDKFITEIMLFRFGRGYYHNFVEIFMW